MPRPNVADERKQQIIEAAFAAFAHSGLGQTRMSDIAKEAGLSKGTLYLYFDSKEALIGALLNQFSAREVGRHQGALDHGIPTQEKLRLLADAILIDTERIRSTWPLYLELLALVSRQTSARNALQAPLQDLLQPFILLFEHGIESGEEMRADPRLAAITLLSIVEGLVLLWARAPAEVDLTRDIHGSLDLLFQGLLRSTRSVGADDHPVANEQNRERRPRLGRARRPDRRHRPDWRTW